MLVEPALCCVPEITCSDNLTQSSCHPCKGTQTPSLLLSFAFSYSYLSHYALFLKIQDLLFIAWEMNSVLWFVFRFTVHMGSSVAARLTQPRSALHPSVVSRSAKTAKRNASHGGWSPRPALDSSAQRWYWVGQCLRSKEEEGLSSGSEQAGWTQTVAEWCFLCLSRLCRYPRPTREGAAAVE